MKRIVSVVGARPQFIKAAVVSRALKRVDSLQEDILHTGQHYDQNMSSVFFDELEIPSPRYNLEIGGGMHGEMTAKMMISMEQLFLNERPDALLVFGDTNSTLAGALVASKMHIPVFHVEAGLRSFNKNMPEEINRILTDHVSDLLFCPTTQSEKLLKSEGVDEAKIRNVGDVMFDAVKFYQDKAEQFDFGFDASEFVFCTLHRAENTDSKSRLEGILKGLEGIDLPVLLPIHPRTKKKMSEFSLSFPENVKVVEPMPYMQVISALNQCAFVVTDSGGLQKEAHYMGKFCITARDETEWVELVENGVNFLTGADTDKIIQAARLVSVKGAPDNVSDYGTGNAGSKIAGQMYEWLK